MLITYIFRPVIFLQGDQQACLPVNKSLSQGIGVHDLQFFDDAASDHVRRLFRRQVRKGLIGNLVKNFNEDLFDAREAEAVFRKGVIRAADDDGQDGDLLFQRQLEGAGLEFFHLTIGRAGALGKDEYGTAFVDAFFALNHHLFDAFLVAAFEPDVAVQDHVPTDQGQPEVFNFRHPFKMKEEPEDHQDVEEGLVV